MHVYGIISAVVMLIAIADGKARIDWIVYRNVSNFGDTLTLFCEVDSCCKETAGWAMWIMNQSDFKTLILDARNTPYSEEAKYDARISRSGFYLMITNISSEDFEKYYSCTYGVYTSPKRLLTKGEAFVEQVTTTCSTSAIGNHRNDMYIFPTITTAIFLVAFLVTLTILCRRKTTDASQQDENLNLNENPVGSEQVENEIPDSPDTVQPITEPNENDRLLNQADCRPDASSVDIPPSVDNGLQVRRITGSTVNDNSAGNETNFSAHMTPAMHRNESPQTSTLLELRQVPSSPDTVSSGHQGFQGNTNDLNKDGIDETHLKQSAYTDSIDSIESTNNTAEDTACKSSSLSPSDPNYQNIPSDASLELHEGSRMSIDRDTTYGHCQSTEPSSIEDFYRSQHESLASSGDESMHQSILTMSNNSDSLC